MRLFPLLFFLFGCLGPGQQSYSVELLVQGDLTNLEVFDNNQTPHRIRIDAGQLSFSSVELEDDDGQITSVVEDLIFDVESPAQSLGQGILSTNSASFLRLVLIESSSLQGHMIQLFGEIALASGATRPLTVIIDQFSIFTPIVSFEINNDLTQTVSLDIAKLLGGIDYELLANGVNEVSILPGSNEELLVIGNLSGAFSLQP